MKKIAFPLRQESIPTKSLLFLLGFLLLTVYSKKTEASDAVFSIDSSSIYVGCDSAYFRVYDSASLMMSSINHAPWGLLPVGGTSEHPIDPFFAFHLQPMLAIASDTNAPVPYVDCYFHNFDTLDTWISLNLEFGVDSTLSDTFEIYFVSDPIGVSIVYHNNDCGNYCTSSITAQLNATYPSSLIIWDWQDTTSTLDSLCIDDYGSVHIWDSLAVQTGGAQGCIVYRGYTIWLPVGSVQSHIHPSFCGDSTGSILISTDTSEISIYWEHGDSTWFIDNLVSGSYVYYLYNEYECLQSDTIEVLDSCGTITGYVFHDRDGDGELGIGDEPLSGVLVESSEGFTTISNASGFYQLYGVTLQSHNVSIDVPEYAFECGLLYNTQYNLVEPVGGSYQVNLSNALLTSSDNNFVLSRLDSADCGKVYGSVWQDNNSNGIWDTGEPMLPNIPVTNGANTSWTNVIGQYCLPTPLNNGYTISVNQSAFSPCIPLIDPMGYAVMLDDQNPNVSGLNFAVDPLSCTNAQVVALNVFAGNDAGELFNAWIDIKINGVLSQPCTLRIDHDTLVSFKSSSLPADSVGPDFVEWYFQPGSYNNQWYCIQMTWCIDSAVSAGYTLNWLASVNCGVPDIEPNDDVLSRNVSVLTGPLKTGSEHDQTSFFYSLNRDGILPYGISRDDSLISYVLVFYNTTDREVKNVSVVVDLSEHLDQKSITRAFSSFPSTTTLVDGQLVIDMKNLVLTDTTTNPVGSYGFVQFNAKLKSGVPIGSEVLNTASVHFDYYDAIAELAVENEILGTVIEENEISGLLLYPNPTNGIFVVDAEGVGDGRIEITDMLGKTVYKQRFTGKLEIELSDQKAGIYMVTVIGDFGTISNMLILQR